MSDEKHYKITVVCNEAARDDLEPLLRALEWCGHVGCTRDFSINNLGEDIPQDFTFDGDGPSQIFSIDYTSIKAARAPETTMKPLDMSSIRQLEAELKHLAPLLPSLEGDLLNAARVASLVTQGDTRVASRNKQASESLFETLTDYCSSLARISQKILRKVPELTAHKVSDANHWAETTRKSDRTRYRLQYGIDACDLDSVMVVVTISTPGGEVLERLEYDGAMDSAEIAEQACDAFLAKMVQ